MCSCVRNNRLLAPLESWNQLQRSERKKKKKLLKLATGKEFVFFRNVSRKRETADKISREENKRSFNPLNAPFCRMLAAGMIFFLLSLPVRPSVRRSLRREKERKKERKKERRRQRKKEDWKKKKEQVVEALILSSSSGRSVVAIVATLLRSNFSFFFSTVIKSLSLGCYVHIATHFFFVFVWQSFPLSFSSDAFFFLSDNNFLFSSSQPFL